VNIVDECATQQTRCGSSDGRFENIDSSEGTNPIQRVVVTKHLLK
jgi:hypothetical protein